MNNQNSSSTTADDQNQTPTNVADPAVSEKPEELVQTGSDDQTSVGDDAAKVDEGVSASSDQLLSEPVTQGEAETVESSPLSEAGEIGSEPNRTGSEKQSEEAELENKEQSNEPDSTDTVETPSDDSGARWYVIHTYSGHENRVARPLKQGVASEHLEGKILEVLVPTQDKIEIKSGKKETVKEKIFPGYILVKMILDDNSWLVVRTTQGVTSFVGMGNKPTPIPDYEVKTIISFTREGQQPTYKTVYSEGDTVKIVDGPFAEFIGKVDTVDKDRGKVKVLVSIFGRETPVELDFLQVQKL